MQRARPHAHTAARRPPQSVRQTAPGPHQLVAHATQVRLGSDSDCHQMSAKLTNSKGAHRGRTAHILECQLAHAALVICQLRHYCWSSMAQLDNAVASTGLSPLTPGCLVFLTDCVFCCDCHQMSAFHTVQGRLTCIAQAAVMRAVMRAVSLLLAATGAA
jgi:hypothetical protein